MAQYVVFQTEEAEVPAGSNPASLKVQVLRKGRVLVSYSTVNLWVIEGANYLVKKNVNYLI